MLRTRAKYLARQALAWAPMVVGLVLLGPQLAEARDALFTAGSILPVVHVLLIPFLPLLVFSSVISLWALPSQNRFDAYLEAAWRGDAAQPPLADQQPEPDATTLALPTTIRLRPHWHVVVGMDVLFFLMGGLYIVAYILTDTPPSSQPDPLAVLVFAILALFVVMAPFTQRTSGKGFTVSEEGLQMHNMPTSTSGMYAIKWSEVRLFAIADGRKNDQTRSSIYWLHPVQVSM